MHRERRRLTHSYPRQLIRSFHSISGTGRLTGYGFEDTIFIRFMHTLINESERHREHHRRHNCSKNLRHFEVIRTKAQPFAVNFDMFIFIIFTYQEQNKLKHFNLCNRCLYIRCFFSSFCLFSPLVVLTYMMFSDILKTYFGDRYNLQLRFGHRMIVITPRDSIAEDIFR